MEIPQPEEGNPEKSGGGHKNPNGPLIKGLLELTEEGLKTSGASADDTPGSDMPERGHSDSAGESNSDSQRNPMTREEQEARFEKAEGKAESAKVYSDAQVKEMRAEHKEVMSKLNGIEERLDTRLTKFETVTEGFESKLDNRTEAISANIRGIKDSVVTNRWVIGIIVALAAIATSLSNCGGGG